MNYFDAHAHLQLENYDADRDAVLARMRESGTGAIMVGVDLKTSREAVVLAERYDYLWAAVGLHPNDNPTEAFDDVAFAELAAHPRTVAIGECGLDYFRSGGTDEEKAAQKTRFEAQIALAARVGKPLIIHCRNAHEDMLTILADAKREYGDKLVIVMHFFTVSGAVAQKYIDLDCYLSFPGPITYADMYDDSIRLAPLERILSETDSPFAAPVPYRGKRNEPVYAQEVVKKLATIKGIESAEIARQILVNARRVFRI